MTTIRITDPETCACASAWCKCNINKWKLDFEFGKTTTYIFQFSSARDATLFALKWVR